MALGCSWPFSVYFYLSVLRGWNLGTGSDHLEIFGVVSSYVTNLKSVWEFED